MTPISVSPQVTAPDAVAAHPVLPPERQIENLGNNPMQQPATLAPATGSTRWGYDPVVVTVRRAAATRTWRHGAGRRRGRA